MENSRYTTIPTSDRTKGYPYVLQSKGKSKQQKGRTPHSLLKAA